MSFSTALEVGIGLMLVYYVMGLIVNILVEEVKKLLQIRAKTLEEALSELLESYDDGGGGDRPGNALTVQNLTGHPLMENLKPTHRWLFGLVSRLGKIPKMPNTTFAYVFLELLKPADESFRLEAVRKAVENLPDEATRNALLKAIDLNIQDDKELLANIRQAVLALSDGETQDTLLKLVDFGFASSEDQLKAVRETIQKMDEGKTKRALLSLLDYEVQNIEQARKKVEGWFDDMMQKSANLFGQRVRSWVILFSFALTLAVGTDSIAVAQFLWDQPAHRAAVEAGMSEVVEQYKDSQDVEDVQPMLDALVELDIPITWAQSPLPSSGGRIALKFIGVIITAIAASRGSSFWYDILKKVNPASPSKKASA